MEQSTESDVAGYLLDVQPSTMLDGLKIMEALSNEDAVNLFFYAEKGITSSTEAIKALGITQKRYYTRLKLLLEAGLLEKTKEGYRHTLLGTLVHKLGLALLDILENKEQLDILQSIRKSGSISLEATGQIASALSIEIPFALTSDLRELLSPVRMVDSYDELVKELIKEIDKSEKNIYFASKYTDARVVEATIGALQRNVKISLLMEKMNITQGIQVLRMILSPKSISVFSKFLQEYSHILRQIPTLSYSFIIIDERYTIIEVPHPTKNQFHLGFIFENPKVSQKLIEIFLAMWEKSGKYSFL